MIKYSFEQKKALVTAYLNGEGGIRTVIKKYGYSNRSQLQRWIVAYQMYGDDGLKISQKTFNYSFEKKLTDTNTPNGKILSRFEKEDTDTSIEHVKELEAELHELRIENAFLKELRRLRLEDEAKMRERRESSTVSEENSN